MEMVIWRFGLENRKLKWFGRMIAERTMEWCTGCCGRTEVEDDRLERGTLWSHNPIVYRFNLI
jgi:hypothetical protein